MTPHISFLSAEKVLRIVLMDPTHFLSILDIRKLEEWQVLIEPDLKSVEWIESDSSDSSDSELDTDDDDDSEEMDTD